MISIKVLVFLSLLINSSLAIKIIESGKTIGSTDFHGETVDSTTKCNPDHYNNPPPLYYISDGAVIKNLVVGPNSGNGLWCLGSCTLINVKWQSVCRLGLVTGSKDPKSLVDIQGGSATLSSWQTNAKLFLHYGTGTLRVSNFYADQISSLAISCGECPGLNIKGHPRIFEFNNVVINTLGYQVVGLRTEYGDVAKLNNVKINKSIQNPVKLCAYYPIMDGGSKGTAPSNLWSFFTQASSSKPYHLTCGAKN